MDLKREHVCSDRLQHGSVLQHFWKSDPLLRSSALLFFPSVTGQTGRGSLCWWTLVSQLFSGLLQGWGGQRGRVSEPRGQAEPRQPVPGPHAQPVQLRQQLRQRDLHPGCCPHRQQRTGHRVHVSVSHTHTHIHMGSVCVCVISTLPCTALKVCKCSCCCPAVMPMKPEALSASCSV